MAEEEKQDGQKTIVAFVVGLLIGGMLVWAFSGSDAKQAPSKTVSDDETARTSDNTNDSNDVDAPAVVSETEETPVPTLAVGDGDIDVRNQAAGTSVALESAIYPVSEGWIGVRDFNNDQLGTILGVVRFSESQGLIPNEIVLLRPTTPGNTYAVVVFKEDGDFAFNLANDVQIDTIYSTFTAQ